MYEHKKQIRYSGIDLIRCIAVFFVLSVHFFMYIGYYQTALEGKRMFLMTLMRWLFYTCVPLFMLLSGYLLNAKVVSKRYYVKIFRIIYEYITACILCNVFKVIYLKQNVSIRQWISSILDFTAAPYSWYINMYIGLFLLIPFLNLAYGKDKLDKNQKKILILSLIILTAIPSFLNGIFQTHGSCKVFPDWWTNIYPVTYYFIGCYISEYNIKLNRLKCILGILLLIIIEGIISFKYNIELRFNWNIPYGYGALPTLIISVLIFLLIYELKCSNKYISQIISSVSKCSLSIYLVSYIFDTIIYKYLNNIIITVHYKLFYYFLVVPLIFILSYIVAFIIQLPLYFMSKRLSDISI